MQARGNTVIPQGLSWGWRAISPSAPFVEGAPYGDQDTIKAIILLTDGANAVASRDRSQQLVLFGLRVCKLGPPRQPQRQRGERHVLDAKTTQVCNNIKADKDGVSEDQDILIFAISFVDEGQIGSSAAARIRALLQGCATPDADFVRTSSVSMIRRILRFSSRRLLPLPPV